MRRSELDLGERTWTIPGNRTKNDKPHIVHLSELAMEVLSEVPVIVDQDLVFSGTGKRPVSGFSRAKARLDQAMLAKLRDAAADSQRVELTPRGPHDMRRTAPTRRTPRGPAASGEGGAASARGRRFPTARGGPGGGSRLWAARPPPAAPPASARRVG